MQLMMTNAKTSPVCGAVYEKGILNALTYMPSAPDDTLSTSNTFRAGLIKHAQPVSADVIYGLKDISGHHSSCIQAKKYATVGLGFIDDGDGVVKAGSDQEAAEKASSLLSGQGYIKSKVDDILDPLTTFGFAYELLNATEDFMDTGTGYLEVHRDASGKIDGICQVPFKHLWYCTYNGKAFYQYSPMGQTTKYWVPFGKANKEWLVSATGPLANVPVDAKDISEVIPFLQPSNRVRGYGYPDWLSASVDIELIKRAKQYKADFYQNRGVLDKVLIVTGEIVDADKWQAIENSLQNSIGMGNNFGSLALNFGAPDVTVEVKDMGVGAATEDQFAKDNETLTQNVVSSHGVPPLLANILIPGKLGASNEFINALIGFQLLRINSYQNVIEKQLARTLGGDDGVEGLTVEDFRLRTITSQIDLSVMDTVGRMRSEVTSGENKDRDLSKGVKD